jgi:hypothetical protein
MQRTTAFLMSACIGAGACAFAADPPVSPTQVEAGQPAPVAAAAPPAASAPAAAAATADSSAKSEPTSKNDVTPAQMKAFRQAGYKPEVRNGQTYFCRKEAQLGTRFESKTCGTAAEIERATASSQELAERIQTKAFVKAPGSP